MRVMIVGQKWLAAETLKLCLALGHRVVKVVAPSGDDRLIQAAIEADVHAAVIEHRIDAGHVLDGTDLIVAAHAHCYIAPSAIERARLGAIGYHPSLLPRHRGRDAIEWVIRMREPVTGGTVYWMDDRADGGPVIAQDWCFVRPGDNASELWRRELAPMGLRLFRTALDRIAAGDISGKDQDEDLATWEPAITRNRLAG